MIRPGFPDSTPPAGPVGGVLIDLAAALMRLDAGRIASVPGITARSAGPSDGGMSRDGAWAFVIGLPLRAFVVAALWAGSDASFADPVALAVAALLIAIGTRSGSGGTNGHDVCGVSRLPRRSLVAAVTRMVTGIAAVAAMNAPGVQVP